MDITAPGRAVRSSYARNQINTQWQASLNFNNMFDKRYDTSIGDLANSSHYGNPRNVMLKLRGSLRCERRKKGRLAAAILIAWHRPTCRAPRRWQPRRSPAPHGPATSPTCASA